MVGSAFTKYSIVWCSQHIDRFMGDLCTKGYVKSQWIERLTGILLPSKKVVKDIETSQTHICGTVRYTPQQYLKELRSRNKLMFAWFVCSSVQQLTID